MSKVVVKVKKRRLPPDQSFTEAFVSHFPPFQSIKLPDDWCVVTASNRRMFIGLQLLYSSLRTTHEVDLMVFDLGLTPAQRSWCQQQPRLLLCPVNYPVNRGWFYWEAWYKPLYIYQCPFPKCLWIDADCFVFGNLNSLINLAEESPVFTSDYTDVAPTTLNNHDLYWFLPNGTLKDVPPYVNTGVFALDKRRDKKLIEEWCYSVLEAAHNKDVAAKISCWDQGAAKWALQKLHLVHHILDNIMFNYPLPGRQQMFQPRAEIVEAFFQMTASARSKAIVGHWMGSPKPWENWGEALNLTVASSR